MVLPDEGLDVQFYMGAVEDSAASEASKAAGGPPVFKDVPFVRIKMPGNMYEIIDTVAWTEESNENSHIRRFPLAWARFKSGDTAGVGGFPLKDWAQVPRSVVELFAHFSVKSVEQLAALTDSNLQRIPLPNVLQLRAEAQAFIAQRQSTEGLRAELDALRAQLAQLSASAKVTVIPESAAAQVFAPPPVDDEVEQAIGKGQPPEISKAVTLAIETESKPRRRGRKPKTEAANA